MNHQVLEPSTGEAIALPAKLSRRVPFRLQSSDLKLVASSGMIVCSAMLAHQTFQATVSQASPQPCEGLTNVSGANRCPQVVAQSVSATPEPLHNHQWSDRLFRQLQGQSDGLPAHMESMYADLLNEAQSAASRDQLTEAVKLIAGIPKNSRHHELAQQLEDDWSRELVRQATTRFQQADVMAAMALLETIPNTSQWHDRVTELRDRWSQQAKVYDRAIAAKSGRNWQGAIDSIKQLEGSPIYNSLPVQELLQQAMTKLYEPDATLVQIAAADTPMMAIAPPEMVSVMY
ncbi:hypothetical protein [Phormidesmis sp. 146-33]